MTVKSKLHIFFCELQPAHFFFPNQNVELEPHVPGGHSFLKKK